jgi:DNA-directed RNA polymerase specialized sigma24 family protein
MNERQNCRCPLCLIEQKLRTELADPDNQERHRILLSSAPHLAVFRTAADLLSHLHSLAGNSSSDPLLAELLDARNLFPGSMVDSLFVLLFLPVLHSTLRRVRKRYPALSREDVVQQALGALFEYLASAHLAARDTYLAFAIARKVRRATFEWAAREAKSPLEAPRSDDPRETNSSESAEESFERASLLRHFFGRAVETGTLTPGELNLLIQFKIEGGSENGAFSNAERQRLKRLLDKLRKLVNRAHGTRP